MPIAEEDEAATPRKKAPKDDSVDTGRGGSANATPKFGSQASPEPLAQAVHAFGPPDTERGLLSSGRSSFRFQLNSIGELDTARLKDLERGGTQHKTELHD